MIQSLEQFDVLVADDEPDVFLMTRLALKGMRYADRGITIRQAASGAEAREALRLRPDTAVLLLDVVMETSSAGLDACRAIREELGNRLVRILLRTGQPGHAPERQVIEEYDIDGYLPKSELTTPRLYSAVRTAIKAFVELVTLERHRQALGFLHDAVAALHSFQPLEDTLRQILAAAVALLPAPLAVLSLETYQEQGDPQRRLLHAAPDPAAGADQARRLVEQIAADPGAAALREGGEFAGGWLVPLRLHRDLGHGWIHLQAVPADALVRQTLTLLASHCANALYASVAQQMLADREGPFFESVAV